MSPRSKYEPKGNSTVQYIRGQMQEIKDRADPIRPEYLDPAAPLEDVVVAWHSGFDTAMDLVFRVLDRADEAYHAD